MKITSKQNIGVFIFIFIIALTVLCFYWYEVRPAKARSLCSSKVKERVFKTDGPASISSLDFYYKLCLRDNGLKE